MGDFGELHRLKCNLCIINIVRALSNKVLKSNACEGSGAWAPPRKHGRPTFSGAHRAAAQWPSSESAQHADRRRFAGAVWTEEAVDRAAPHAHRKVTHHFPSLEGFREALDVNYDLGAVVCHLAYHPIACPQSASVFASPFDLMRESTLPHSSMLRSSSRIPSGSNRQYSRRVRNKRFAKIGNLIGRKLRLRHLLRKAVPLPQASDV
jgi:hypothetical protein